MDKKSRVSASKFLSLVPRHQPETIGLMLDENGWARVDDLLERMAAAGQRLDRADLEEVVATNEKQRFRCSDDDLQIRANQGHSIDVDLQLTPADPPDVLFHGTADHNLDSIL